MIPPTPKVYGGPKQKELIQKVTMIAKPMIFTKWGDMKDEDIFQEDFLRILYKDECNEPEPIQPFYRNTSRKGYQIAKNMGYYGKRWNGSTPRRSTRTHDFHIEIEIHGTRLWSNRCKYHKYPRYLL